MERSLGSALLLFCRRNGIAVILIFLLQEVLVNPFALEGLNRNFTFIPDLVNSFGGSKQFLPVTLESVLDAPVSVSLHVKVS